ncbi:MAG: Prephenate dehydrogenase/arogenate dehydrogenase family protein [Acidimicrobiaceae bacterium]|nr:Prephenate dehydrogenase/arogenate dehydrogenase family protein [Acidimicrobiaceae bacterium]
MSEAPAGARRRAEVVGLGLIGTSVAWGLRRAGWFVTGSDLRAERAARAEELGAIDAIGEDLDAELAIVATPVAAIAEVSQRLLERGGRPNFVVTDVGGVKGELVSALGHPRFVGGHPMAGSEQEGPDGADPELFHGATWVLTPTAATDEAAYATVRQLVSVLGAEVVALAPVHHDEMVAVVSHVPHLTAATLMGLAAGASVEHASLLRLSAGGFRDMTRVAAGDPAIWPDIFRDNASAVLVALDGLIARLGEARRIVAEQDRTALVELLEEAKSARRNLPPRVPRAEDVVECRIPVPDRPGALAEVTTLLGELGVNVFDVEIAHSAESEGGVLVLTIARSAAELARKALAGRGYRAAIWGLS